MCKHIVGHGYQHRYKNQRFNAELLNQNLLFLKFKEDAKHEKRIKKFLFQSSHLLSPSIMNTKNMYEFNKEKLQNNSFFYIKNKSEHYLPMKKLKNQDILTKLLRRLNFYFSLDLNSSSSIRAFIYYKQGQMLISAFFLKEFEKYGLNMWTFVQKKHNYNEQMNSNKNHKFILDQTEIINFQSFYASSYFLKQQLSSLIAGKIAEFFLFSTVKNVIFSPNITSNNQLMFHIFTNKWNKFALYKSAKAINNAKHEQSTNFKQPVFLINTSVVQSLSNSCFYLSKSQIKKVTSGSYSLNKTLDKPKGIWNIYGMNKIWKFSYALFLSIIQKRYLYNSSYLISQFLYIEEKSILKDNPGPSFTFILLSGRKYENLKRAEYHFQQNKFISLQEKQQYHEQQRFIKSLYKKPLDFYFRSEINSSQKKFSKIKWTNFFTSFRELSGLNSYTISPGAANYYSRNKILLRQKFYLKNQWWNGHLAEHNIENTFLSEVDWRSLFKNSLGDIFIDFPDPDQHYNPQTRRWLLTSGFWSYWDTFQKFFYYEIYYCFTLDSFSTNFQFLNSNRESLDIFSYTSLRLYLSKEIDFIQNFLRFYIIAPQLIGRTQNFSIY